MKFFVAILTIAACASAADQVATITKYSPVAVDFEGKNYNVVPVNINIAVGSGARSSIQQTYVHLNQTMSFPDGSRFCNKLGMILASPKTEAEQKLLTTFLATKEVKGNIWLSGYCDGGWWTWADGVLVGYNNFKDGITACFDEAVGLMMFGSFAPVAQRYWWNGEHDDEFNFIICQ